MNTNHCDDVPVAKADTSVTDRLKEIANFKRDLESPLVELDARMSELYNRRPRHTLTEIKQLKLKITRQILDEFNDNSFYLLTSSQLDDLPGKQDARKQSPIAKDRTSIQGRRKNKIT